MKVPVEKVDVLGWTKSKKFPPRIQEPYINILYLGRILFHTICGFGTLVTDLHYVLWEYKNTFLPPIGVLRITKYLHWPLKRSLPWSRRETVNVGYYNGNVKPVDLDHPL